MNYDDPDKYQKEFDKKVEELAKQLETEGKITREALEFYILDNHEVYWMEMQIAAMRILMEEPVEFLTPEEVQRIVDEHNEQAARNAQRLRIEQQENQKAMAAASQDDSLGCFFAVVLTLAKWIFIIASGLIVPYLIYRVIKFFIKSAVKSSRGG